MQGRLKREGKEMQESMEKRTDKKGWKRRTDKKGWKKRTDRKGEI